MLSKLRLTGPSVLEGGNAYLGVMDPPQHVFEKRTVQVAYVFWSFDWLKMLTIYGPSSRWFLDKIGQGFVKGEELWTFMKRALLTKSQDKQSSSPNTYPWDWGYEHLVSMGI